MQRDQDNSVEEQLYKLETDLFRPEIRRTPEALLSLLAEEFCEFGSSGRSYRRQEIIDSLSTESSVNISITGFSAISIAAGVALVKYQAALSSESKPQATLSLRSSLWIVRDNRWQMLFHQGTNVSQ